MFLKRKNYKDLDFINNNSITQMPKLQPSKKKHKFVKLN